MLWGWENFTYVGIIEQMLAVASDILRPRGSLFTSFGIEVFLMYLVRFYVSIVITNTV